MSSKALIRKILLSGILVAGFSITALSQPADPGNPEAPITGLEFLLGAGALYGFKKVHDLRKKKIKGDKEV